MSKEADQHPGLRWIMSHLNELEEKYPEQWVVASKDGLEGHGPSLLSLFDAIARKKPEAGPGEFAAHYLGFPGNFFR